MKRKLKNWFAVFLALIMGLGTLTAQNTVPLNEGFSNGLPDDWVINGSGSITSEGYFKVTYGCSGYLITQKVMPTESNHTLSFDLWVCQYCNDKETNSFDLMLSTTNAEVSSFTSVLHVDGNDIACLQGEGTLTVDLTSYIGQEIYIAFYITDAGDGANIAVDNISGVDVILPACAKPTGLAVSGITSSTATVSWTGAADSYQLKYKTTAAEDWTTVTTSTNPYTIEGLEANTNYMVELSTVCGSEFSDAATTSFKTLCSSIAITGENAWEENFDSESTLNSCMALSDSYFTFATSDASNGRSANSGTNYIYAKWSANSYVYTPYFELTAGTPYKFTFMYVTDGSEGWTTLEAGLFTEQNSSALVSAVGSPVSGPTNTTYTQYKGVFTPTESGTYCIGIHVQATGSPWYMSIDDLSLGLAPSCVEPTELAVSDITSSSAQVSWTGDAESYQLSYAVTGEDDYTTTTVSGNTYTIPSLDANTNYTVEIKSICGSDLSDAATTTFKTECAAISVTETPYTTSFEDDATGSGTVPACWTKISGSSYPYVYTSSYTNYARTGSKTLYWSYNANPVALPTFVEDVKDLQLSFFARDGYSAYDMQVGVMTDPTDAETFEQVATVSLTTSYPEEAYVVRFKSYTGAGQYIALRPATATSYFVDDITVELAPTCFEPENIVASNITTSSATITWEDESESTAWTLEYKKASETEYTAIEGLTEKTYNLPSLDVNTIYNVRVTGNCEGGETVSDVVTFSTSALNVTAIPFTENFEESNSYVQLSGTGTNQWFVGNATATVDGENSLYVSNDNGVSNAYSVSTSDAYAIINVVFGDAVGYDLSFDWKANGENGWDMLNVYLLDVDAALPSGRQTSNSNAIFHQSALQGSWTNTEAIELAGVSNTSKKIVFHWYNDGYDGDSQPPAAVDNISIVAKNCDTPTIPTVSDISVSTADVAWTEEGITVVEYKTAADENWTSVSVTASPKTLTDLTSNTTYTVRTGLDCAGEMLYSPTTTFKTECAAIVVTGENSWTENFDSESTLNSCMALSDSYFTFATSDASNGRSANSGTNYIYAKWSANSYVYTPYFELTAGTPYKFTFMYVTDGSEGWTTLEAGLFTEQNSSALVSAVGSPVSGPTNTTYTQYKGVFTPTESGTYCIGIHVQATGSPWYMSIDDLSLGLAPSCVEPTELAVSDITSSSATVSWAGTADSYQLRYTVTGEDNYTSTTVSGNTYTIPSLAANTNYTVEVQSICGSDLSDAATTTFKTECAAIVVTDENAWTEDFETLSTSDFGCWTDIQEAGSYNWDILANSGSKAAHRNYYTGSNRLVSPVLDITGLTAPFLTYDWEAHMDGSSLDNIYVYYRTNSDAEWILLAEHTSNADGSIYSISQSNIVALPNATATYQIAFLADCHGGYGVAIDNVVVKNITCAEPADVAVSGITSSTATVSWTGDAESYQLRYTVTGEDNYTSTTVSGNTYTIPSLAANTNYTVEVQSICGSDLSDAATTTFKTECAAISVTETPYTTSFEDDATGSGTVPACWTKISGSSYPYVYTSSYTNYARTGSKTLYWSYNANPVALPTFVEDVKDLQLSFFARGGSYYDGGGSMEVGVMTDPTDASTFVTVATITTAYSSYPEEANVVRFKSYTGAGQYIALRPATATSYFVDDITVELAPTCFEPENIVASNITTSSATITWEDESESTAWTLEYKKASETEYTAIEGLTEKTYNLPSLDVNTIYNVRVTGNCEGGETVSDVVTFSTSALNVTAIPFTENFEESNSYVQLSGTGTNQWFVGNATATVDGENSLYVSNDGGENNAYTHSESNAYAVMNIEFGDADEYFLSFDWKSRGESASWDRLMVFLMDENEDLSTLSSSYTTGRIFNQSTFTADPTWQNATITLNDVQNTTKKLVFYWYNDGSGGNNPPAAIDNITIAECVAPSDVVVSNITANTADLVWNDLGGSNTWTVEYKKASEESWTTVSGQTTTAYAFEDLRPNTSYEVRVVGNCNTTKYSDVAQFTTLCLPTASEREATICDNETYTDADFTLTAENEGINEIVLQNQYGCDSTITLTLTVNPTYAPVFDVVICEGESYAFNGQSYTEAGTYTGSLQTINGCDSVVTLNLSVTPLNNQTFNATICEGETYNENGFMANESGTYTREVVENGCTSTWTLNLTVTPTNNQTFNATICEGETYNENGFMANESGTYTREVVENGCTSTWTLNLTVLPVYAQTISATICEGESYTFNGQSYTEAGTYTASLQTINGCDSTVTLNLSVTPLNNQTFNATICQGEIYNQNGFMANESGTYTREVVENGCTSTWTLNLTVLPLQTETIDETICYGETFTYNGQTYSQTGTYTTVVEGEDGACNTEVTINLVVRDANADIDELVVLNNADLPYEFMGNEYTDYGTYVVTVQDENGCEQVYNLTIQHNSGLNAVESNVLVSVYPNPTIDNATLRVEGLTEDATVVVTDQTGRMISSERLALGQTEMTINSASLAEGVYYIRIITSNSTRTEKLIRR